MTAFSDSVAVILGASEWPYHEDLGAHKSFANSASAISKYLQQHGIADILTLFDEELSPDDVVSRIRAFLNEEKAVASRTILLCYVGHGGARDGKYLLALRRTKKDDLEVSCLGIRHVARVLYDVAADKRHIVILDSCYAGAADREFIEMNLDDAASLMGTELRDEMPATDMRCGTSLFCAASPVKTAMARKQDEFTMFSGALLHVLSTGDPHSGEAMTLDRVAQLVETRIRTSFRSKAVRPELRSPRQDNGDIRHLPFFPNPSWKRDPSLAELNEKRAALATLERDTARLAHELAWEREAEVLGWYELREARKEIDAFGDSVEIHRGVGIHGPATGERSEIPYHCVSNFDLGTCVIEEICHLGPDGGPVENLPQPGRNVSGTVDLVPPATVANVHPGFSLTVRMMNNFAVTKEDANLRGLNGPESSYIQVLFPARFLRMAITFPEGYTPSVRPVLQVDEVTNDLGSGPSRKSIAETARLRHAVHFDQQRGIAVLAIERALPRFRYNLKWSLPNAPRPGPAAIRAREQIRALIRLERGKRGEAGLQLAQRRDAICADHFGWRQDDPRTVNLSLWIFDEKRRVAKMICQVPEIDGTIELPSGAGVVGRVMKRRRAMFVDTRDAANVGIYRSVPNQPDDRFILCVPVPLPTHADAPTTVNDPSVPCVIAALTCLDDTGNLERLAYDHGSEGDVADDLMKRVVSDIVAAAVVVMARLV